MRRTCRLTLRWSARASDKVSNSCSSAGGAQLNRQKGLDAMQILITVITTIFMLVMSSAHAACSKRTVMSMRGEDGVLTGIVISTTQLEKAPTWTPGRGEPPLSVARAVDIASQWGRIHYRKFDSARIDAVGLNEYGCPSRKKYWFYLVQFRLVKNGKHVWGGNFVAVLLDGTLVASQRLDGSF